MKPKVVLLATGGTIASRYDPTLGRTVASQRAEDLLQMLPQVGGVAQLEVVDFATIPSFDMSVQFAFGLARRINELLARPDVAGDHPFQPFPFLLVEVPHELPIAMNGLDPPDVLPLPPLQGACHAPFNGHAKPIR